MPQIFKKLVCKRCRKTFEHNRKKIFCSVECRYLSYLKDGDKKWKTEKKCLICPILFIAKTANQKYCSNKCLTIAYSFEYMAEHGGISGWQKLRFECFKRDNFTCRYCGRNVKDDYVKLHCDHVVPEIDGGLSVMSNLVTACEDCNLGKSDIHLK